MKVVGEAVSGDLIIEIPPEEYKELLRYKAKYEALASKKLRGGKTESVIVKSMEELPVPASISDLQKKGAECGISKGVLSNCLSRSDLFRNTKKGYWQLAEFARSKDDSTPPPVEHGDACMCPACCNRRCSEKKKGKKCANRSCKNKTAEGSYIEFCTACREKLKGLSGRDYKWLTTQWKNNRP